MAKLDGLCRFFDRTSQNLRSKPGVHMARSELFAIEYIPDKRYVVFDPFNGYRIRGFNPSIILIRDQLGDRGIVIRRHTITLDETGLNTDAFFF